MFGDVRVFDGVVTVEGCCVDGEGDIECEDSLFDIEVVIAESELVEYEILLYPIVYFVECFFKFVLVSEVEVLYVFFEFFVCGCI